MNLIEKIINIIQDIFSSDDDEIIYIIDEIKYDDYDVIE